MLDPAVRARLEDPLFTRLDAQLKQLAEARVDDVFAALAALDAATQARDAAEQMHRDWQDHLLRIHKVACDYPFRTELPDDID